MNIDYNLDKDNSGLTAFINVVKDGSKTLEIPEIKRVCEALANGTASIDVYKNKDGEPTIQLKL